MKNPKFLSVNFLLIFFLASIFPQNSHKLTRAESFWGIHFDKHSVLTDNQIGATLTDGMIDSLLILTRPDYIQVDCKGHPGVSSYPTKVGQQAEGYEKDPLELLRKVTNRYNVGLYVHYSGVRDLEYVKHHPEDALMEKDGKLSKKNTSFYGKYSEKLLIPQLKEVALNYGVDGAWIDGECWSVETDFQPKALNEFKQKSKLEKIPSYGEENYEQFLNFYRQKFILYIKNYVDQIHQVAPRFQLCSNWAFSGMMPEPIPEDLKIDFLSGDLDPINSLNAANWQSRCLYQQGKPWDLMAWSFDFESGAVTPKTAVQLCQEVAPIISNGGGCQIYFRQNADISFQPVSFRIIKEVADFVIPRKEFCKDLKVVPQIGLLYSRAGWSKSGLSNNEEWVYSLVIVKSIRGALNALLDGQNSVEVLMTHHIMKKLGDYPMIVIPEWEIIEPELIMKLKEYVKNGGKLIVMGSASTSNFDDILGVKQLALPVQINGTLGYKNQFGNISGKYREIECLNGTEVRGRFYETTDFSYPKGVAATLNKYGKGVVVGIYSDFGSSYLSNSSPVLRDFLSDLIRDVFPNPLVTVNGSHKVNVVSAKKDDKFLIQLVNTSGDHANPNIKSVDDIPNILNLKVSVKTDVKPKSVVLQPEGEPLNYKFEDGKIYTIVPKLKIHSVIEIKM